MRVCVKLSSIKLEENYPNKKYTSRSCLQHIKENGTWDIYYYDVNKYVKTLNYNNNGKFRKREQEKSPGEIMNAMYMSKPAPTIQTISTNSDTIKMKQEMSKTLTRTITMNVYEDPVQNHQELIYLRKVTMNEIGVRR